MEQYLARLDTGANRTCIGTAVAETVGAGEPITTKTITTSSGDTDVRDIYEFAIELHGDPHTVQASVNNRRELSYEVRLGRDVIADYLIDPARTADR
jgi:hypothetical protein